MADRTVTKDVTGETTRVRNRKHGRRNLIVGGLCLLMVCLTIVAVVPKTVWAKTICNACKGTGIILELAKPCPYISASDHDFGYCPLCKGHIGYVGPPCPYCSGAGVILTAAEKEALRKTAEQAKANEAKAKATETERLKRNKPKIEDLLKQHFVFVPGEIFTMGCTAEQGRDCGVNEIKRTVSVRNFSISKYEVTQKLWELVMNDNPSESKGDNLPVTNVSWKYVKEFIQKLNEVTGKNYRLPTEIEWEYAARGGASSKGYKYSGSNNLSDVAWYADNSDGKLQPVGAKLPNELGIYDMSGNVLEWIGDDRGDYSRWCRGGTFYSDAKVCRVSARDERLAGYGLDFVGFRLARTLSSTEEAEWIERARTEAPEAAAQAEANAIEQTKKTSSGNMTGGRSRGNIQSVVMQNMAALRYAYNKRLRDKPGLTGKIVIKFAINEFGKVISAQVVESTMADPELESTIVSRVKDWDFGKNDKPGDVTTVTYPFVFSE